MSPELGAGGGSGYPGAIDTNAELEHNQSEGNRTRARAAVPNDLAAAIVAIETELGVDPAGTRATVVSYLQQEHTTTGAHNDAYVVTTSGTQSITGQKTFAGGVNLSASGIWGSWPGGYTGTDRVQLSGAIPWFSSDVQISGIVRTSGDVYFTGSAKLGQVPLARMKTNEVYIDNATTWTTTPATLASFSSVDVTVGDRLLVFWTARVTPQTTTTAVSLTLQQSSGTAIGRYTQSGGSLLTTETAIWQTGTNGTTVQLIQSGSVLLLITSTGTLILAVRGDTSGADATNSAVEMSMMVLQGT